MQAILALAALVLIPLAVLTVVVVRAVGIAPSRRLRELAEARAELQRALVRFTELQEEERRFIAHTLHDQTIQALLATLWFLEDLQPERATGVAMKEVVARVQANLGEAVAAARSMVRDLRPPALDELGVVAAVEQELHRLADETGISVSIDGATGGRLPSHVETLTFRTVQEALRNIRQHASASLVQVMIERRGDVLYVEVRDDGIGVDPAVVPVDGRARSGIVAMRENIVMGGGAFSIRPCAGEGTVVLFSLPASLLDSPT